MAFDLDALDLRRLDALLSVVARAAVLLVASWDCSAPLLSAVLSAASDIVMTISYRKSLRRSVMVSSYPERITLP